MTLPAELTNALFRLDPIAVEILERLLTPRRYSAAFCARLIEVARSATAPWETRRIAVLTLEGQLLLAAPRSARALLARIGIPGYTAPEFSAFWRDLKVRLSRLERIHAPFRMVGATSDALNDFLHVSRSECKLSLAPYFFGAEETARRITRFTRNSTGAFHWPESDDEMAPPDFSDFDRSLIELLRGEGEIYWVADRTPSVLNALVEYPVSAVALVVKPPGSDLEFEIKRVGIRGNSVLDVVFERGGQSLPWTHRLQGGSTGILADCEARASNSFAAIYQTIHHREAPMSVTLAVHSVTSIPASDGTAHILRYFTNAEEFGPGFDAMRVAMRKCVEANLTGSNEVLPQEIGLTAQFLCYFSPHQSWLAGTSSFRLDRVAQYLSPEGARPYFDSVSIAPTPADLRRFASEILEEVLGVFHPPAIQTDSYSEYLDAAFEVPQNRVAADRYYEACLGEVGTFWGTLLAVGGCSDGESFVARNVGLKSRWIDGAWTVRLCFMDHDCLDLAIHRDGAFDAERVVISRRQDDRFLFGNREGRIGSVLYLQQIYRPSRDTIDAADALFRRNLEASFRATRKQMEPRGKLRRLFDRDHLQSMLEFERLQAEYPTGSEPGAVAGWETAERAGLVARGYNPALARDYVRAAQRAAEFVTKYGFLYRTK